MFSDGWNDILKKEDNYSPLRRRYTQSPSLPLFLLSTVYHTLRDVSIPPTPPTPSDPTKVRLVCISDTHTHLLPPSEVPEGDILIHAGDLTNSGTAEELGQTLDWLRSLPHPHKVFIAGNHDTGLAHDDVRASLGVSRSGGDLTYLDNEAVDIAVRGRTVRLHGSAWTPQHGNFAFQYPRSGELARELWSGLEPGLDVLVTHGPPRGHVDGLGYGCDALLDAVWRVKPRVMVCGHIHGGRGIERMEWDAAQRMWEGVAGKRNQVGWGGMLIGVWLLLRAWLGGGSRDASLILNCAIVGGRRDQLVRKAAVLDI
jgi:Icc-related predicted phosphoesterase